jgi:hypothetical protein
MRAIAELASSLITGFGTLAARATVVPAPAMLMTALADKPARSAAILGFTIPPHLPGHRFNFAANTLARPNDGR